MNEARMYISIHFIEQLLCDGMVAATPTNVPPDFRIMSVRMSWDRPELLECRVVGTDLPKIFTPTFTRVTLAENHSL